MQLNNAIGGILLIASTAIGAAILALPVSTAHLGFTQTLLFFVLCWIFMTLGALYVLEANLLVGSGSNLISMAEKTLNLPGKYFTWGTYLILLYALMAAHLAGTGAWIDKGLDVFQINLSHFQGALVTAGIIITIILLGTLVVDWLNRLLIIGLISIFVSLIFTTATHVQLPLLFSQMTTFDYKPIPLIITAFGSAIVIPTLTDYLKGNGQQLVKIVLWGSLIPLVVYLTWEWAILGVIPQEKLIAIQKHGHPVKDIPVALSSLLNSKWIPQAASYFSLIALIASFLGLCLSLFDFLADGLSIQKDLKGKILLAIISFAPPLLFIRFYPHGFTFILSLAGIFVALLLGVLPVLMVWRARYQLKLAGTLRIVGEKWLLLITLLFFLTVIGIECMNQWQSFHHTVA